MRADLHMHSTYSDGRLTPLEVIKRANFKWSLSNLVFPHQLVRLILAEQVYRACTINKNEKYHHV